MKTSILQYLAILASAVVLSACASVGSAEKISVTMPGGEGATIIAHNQSAPDWMLKRDGLALNYIVKGDVSDAQLAAVAETERACRIYTGKVRPSNLIAVGSGGVLYALAGGIGVGLGSKALQGTVESQYQRYGAWASGTGGLANGAISLGGQTYTFESCGRDLLDIFKKEYDVRVLMKSPY